MCACSERYGGGPALVAEHLTRPFGQRTAFADMSFEVGYGEVFGFLGPNGAGKTTTVRTLGTLVAPSSGSAVVAGIPLNVITVSTAPALGLAAAPLAIDLLAWRVVAAMSDRERLVTGRRG
jgi:ABC-type Na+ transport system ATPase subunit NatA